MTGEDYKAHLKQLGMDAIEKVEIDLINQRNKYSREIKRGVYADVYDVLKAWDVRNPALQHLLKKALQAGNRGHKDLMEDLQDILDSAKRAIELEMKDENK